MRATGPRLRPSAWSRLKEQSEALGFDALGAGPARPLAQARAELRAGAAASTGLEEWLAAGHQGSMDWMEAKVAERQDPTLWWPGARTVIMGAVSCDAPGEPGDGGGDSDRGPRALVSRHAWGRDYHDIVGGMLKALGRRLEQEVPGAEWRTTLDRTAAMEKPLAVLAGLGWVGKHGNLILEQGSSWYLLGGLLTNADLGESEPFRADHCGTCTACLEACPTGALVAPQVVDATRCVSYLTIETEAAVPEPLREGVGRWVFGCDACQDACPWNSRRTRRSEDRFQQGSVGPGPEIARLLALDEGSFRTLTARTGLRRAGRAGLVRNAALAAGNAGDPGLVPLLAPLLGDAEPSVRRHAAWALGRLGGAAALTALEGARSDPDPGVRRDVEDALGRAG